MLRLGLRATAEQLAASRDDGVRASIGMLLRALDA
jgi:hypothetical protein